MKKQTSSRQQQQQQQNSYESYFTHESQWAMGNFYFILCNLNVIRHIFTVICTINYISERRN